MKTQKSEKDVWIFRLVFLAICMCMLASLMGVIILAVQSKVAPEILVALGSAAVGGLAGLLAPSTLNR